MKNDYEAKRNKMQNSVSSKHTFYIDENNNIILGGIKKIYTYRENLLELETEKGILLIKGNNLYLDEMSIEKKTLNAKGNVTMIAYKNKIDTKALVKWLVK